MHQDIRGWSHQYTQTGQESWGDGDGLSTEWVGVAPLVLRKKNLGMRGYAWRQALPRSPPAEPWTREQKESWWAPEARVATWGLSHSQEHRGRSAATPEAAPRGSAPLSPAANNQLKLADSSTFVREPAALVQLSICREESRKPGKKKKLSSHYSYSFPYSLPHPSQSPLPCFFLFLLFTKKKKKIFL